MIWTEIDLQQEITNGIIQQALAEIFSIDPASILFDSVTDTTQPPTRIDPAIRIVVDRWEQPGDFPVHLLFVLRDGELERQVDTFDKTLKQLRKFCTAVGVDALASDQDLSPYTWLLVRASGEVVPVQLNPVAYDEDRLVIQEPVTSEFA